MIPGDQNTLSAMESLQSILVVDDDESNRESLRRRLERRGYVVATAVDGPAALQSIANGKFDLVILDVMMPGMSGLEVLDVLRREHSPSELPVIIATARDQSEDVVAALDHGANDFVTKPLDFAVVSARVRTQLLVKQSVDQILLLESHLLERNRALENANLRLVQNAERTAQELQAAARVQQAFLPKVSPRVTGAAFSWIFEPCTELAGDSLNVVQLDAQNVGLYVLDVSGHGVAASLLAVAATRLLSPSATGDCLALHAGPDGELRVSEPADVATRLTQNFPMETSEQFITLFYAVYNTATRDLRYVSAGHPDAVHIAVGQPPRVLEGTGLPIGVGEHYEQQSLTLSAGDRIYLYSDGVTEAMNANRDLFGQNRLLEAIQQGSTQNLVQSVALLNEQIQRWREGLPSRDDVSILAMECSRGGPA
jgi:sigma-B regulation protein RsbU (phosphoserine phosphatase)